ncbi:MAG: extracellular solute-binding protein [Cellulomonas sp.]|nr:extracellular solute-binding protein [Cellulomonas sp.]
MRSVRRHRHALPAAAAVAAALVLAGCSSSGGASAGAVASAAPAHLSGTVSLWHFFTDREAEVVQQAVDMFEKANPDVTVDVHSGQDDEKLQKAISAGDSVDVGISYSTDIVGNFCSTGAFRDLTPYIKRDGVDLTQFSDTVRSYTEYQGTRCTMPLLQDVYGLYYNKGLLAAAGYTEAPKTLSELEAMADKLTTYNADGSIATLGFDPLQGWYENAASHYGPAAGASWLKDDGTSAIGTDPAWAELITWQNAYVQKIGYDKLKAFSAASGQEFSTDNDFLTGRVAMNLDGEYRTAFIADQAPTLDYGTAPFPTADDHTDLYGGGYVTGNIAGIAKGSKNPELAWALLKYLTTDTDALVTLSNGLKNAPTTTAALESPDLEVSDQFRTFLDVAASPHAATTPPSPLGAGYQTAFQDFWTSTQPTPVSDLATGLTGVDTDINNQLSLVSGP